MKGLAPLNSAYDLLEKLRREFRRMEDEPADVDHAFNFFVTANQLIDWAYPGDPNKSKRRDLRQVPLLKVCAHIADSAKHFELHNKERSDVTTTSVAPNTSEPMFGPRPFPRRVVSSHLVVKLSPEAAVATGLGMRVRAVDLASSVLNYWNRDAGLRPAE